MRSVENALGMEIPLNAQYIRNIIMGAHAVHDHIVHFYHLCALDWVDIVSALSADAKATQNSARVFLPGSETASKRSGVPKNVYRHW